MLTVGKDGSVIEKLKEILKKYLEGASPKYCKCKIIRRMHIPQELRIRSRGTERHSALN